jgi:hypothetical protein
LADDRPLWWWGKEETEERRKAIMAAHKVFALSATLALAVLCAILLLLPGAKPVEAQVSGVLDAHCGGTLDWNSGFAGEYRAQTFSATRTGELTDARVKLMRFPNARGGVRVQIRPVDPSSGAPDTRMLASTRIPRTAIRTGSFRNAIAHFGSTSVARVSAGHSYALVMKARYGYFIAGTNSGCTGGFYVAPGSGTPFTQGSGDLLFSTFVVSR